MKKISFYSIAVDREKCQITFKDKKVHVDSVEAKYWESCLFSYLEIKVKDDVFTLRTVKSIWEHLRISTYDSLEKREDNKVYNLYCKIIDSKNIGNDRPR